MRRVSRQADALAGEVKNPFAVCQSYGGHDWGLFVGSAFVWIHCVGKRGSEGDTSGRLDGV